MSIMTSRVHSDADIQQDVLEELSWDPHVTVSDIGASVKEGVVTLTGVVENYIAADGCPERRVARQRCSRGRQRD